MAAKCSDVKSAFNQIVRTHKLFCLEKKFEAENTSQGTKKGDSHYKCSGKYILGKWYFINNIN